MAKYNLKNLSEDQLYTIQRALYWLQEEFGDDTEELLKLVGGYTPKPYVPASPEDQTLIRTSEWAKEVKKTLLQELEEMKYVRRLPD